MDSPTHLVYSPHYERANTVTDISRRGRAIQYTKLGGIYTLYAMCLLLAVSAIIIASYTSIL